MAPRRDLFPSDPSLQVRMIAAAVLTPLVVAVALTALALWLPAQVLAGVALAAGVGVVVALRARRHVDEARVLAPGEAPALQAAVVRLCVMAGLTPPDDVVHAATQPNSWIIDPPGRRPRLHLTQGLIDALDPTELEAVVAHELAHVAHSDASVMTVVGLPGSALLLGLRMPAYAPWPLTAGAWLAGLVGLVASVGTNALSRHRELAADRAAARMTGRPAALAAALRKVSGELAAIPTADLRAVAATDALGLLPVESRSDDWRTRLARSAPLRPFAATHPSVARRVAALERLELERHAARPGRDSLLD